MIWETEEDMGSKKEETEDRKDGDDSLSIEHKYLP